MESRVFVCAHLTRASTVTLAPDTDYGLAERRIREAVAVVFDDYRETIERQRAHVVASLHVPLQPARTEARLRFVDDGIEVVVRYPVQLHRAIEVDDRMTRSVLDAINQEPKLKLVSSATPRIQSAA